MARITCPNCGEVIEVDPSQVEDLTRQLRDELFAHDLEARLAEAGHLHEVQLEAARNEERREADRRMAAAEARQAQLQAQLDAFARDQELAIERERTAASEQRAALQHQLDDERARAREQALREAEEARTREAKLAEQVAALTAQLSSQEATLQAQAQVQLLQATAELERGRSELESQLQIERANGQQAQAALREEMARREAEATRTADQRIAAKDEQIEQYKAELERLRDYRIRLSTKLIGESLERHCESEFNRIRMLAYPRATFEKDNTAIEGTKGDFIFRDFDEDGSELLSIMFEMKNEEEQSANASRKTNEFHFKKLDADRTKKDCEYAVLVSTLEPDNDFYNAGIADVSWQYPKMFVVRPQCFTTIIGLLKAAALAAHPYRRQLEQVRQEELDVSTFQDKVDKIVGSIQNDYERAAKNYERAENDIDAIIKKLTDLKNQLRTANNWFAAAQKQGERLTVKRLTRGNATMKAAFAEAEAGRERQAIEARDGSAEPSEQQEGALDPDALE